MSKNREYTSLANKYIVFLFAIIAILTQCTSQNKKKAKNRVENIEYEQELSDKLHSIRNEDSLLIILQQFSEEKNYIGEIICYKNLGSLQRASGRISDAIRSHRQGLIIALQLNDTIQIVQAMNNMGTNFQRLGANSEASQYHYQALDYAEKWSGVHTPIGIKNRIMSLSAIGNISLTLGYYNDAEKLFREVMKYEISEDNPREQAINYANLGAIFEANLQYDSAYAYYQKSMELSKVAKSDIGIGHAQLDFGELYEKEGKYDLAKMEYEKAYELMDKTSNKYNWLEACLSIARIHLITSNYAKFNNYIQLAENTANELKSLEHLAAIYKLKYDYNLRQGNTQLALQNFTQHIALQDSVRGIQKATCYMEIRLGHEHNKNALQLQQMEATNKMKQKQRLHTIYVAWLITILSLMILVALYYAYRLRTRSNKILKKLESARSDFFTKVTHEFRTPLTVIQGLNKQIQEKKDLSEKEKIVFREAIERQSNNLLNLVSLLLDIARLKRGSDNPQWKRGDIVAYLHMTAETFRIYASEKGITLLFYSNIDAQEIDFIPSYIDKIINNIISNAIKHTSAGGKIEFIVNKTERHDNINIHISDTGEGISEEDLELIFDFFYQSPHSKNTSGTGIGLAFTKMMVEKMRGKIVVESKVGKGTMFTITLPLKNKRISYIPPLKDIEKQIDVMADKKDKATNNETDILEQKDSIEKPLILIVEDNKDVTIYLKALLEDKYNVITAWNGEEGIIVAEKHIPDLVITDLMMPVKDGYQFASEMKQNRLLSHIPIIMLTAKTTDEDRIKGLRFGVEAYICKPFLHEELLLLIENIFEKRRVLKEKYMKAIIRSGSESKLHNDANMKFMQNVNAIIHAEIKNPELNSTYIAAQMAMSVSQLSRKINGITGYPTISYVLQLKLSKAKKMLEVKNVSITEVSDACGFYYVSYFSRVFKKEFGLPPSEYKKSVQFELENLQETK